MKRFCVLIVVFLATLCLAFNSFAAYPTTTEHHKVYPYTSIMASPYSGDPTGVVDCAAAIESIKANQSNTGTIYIPKGTFRIGTNLSIPAGMTLEFASAAYLSIDAGITLTLPGPVIAPEGQNCFTGSGVLSLGTTFPVTNITKALQPGTWTVATNTTIPANIILRPHKGAVLAVATGVTLTINGGLEAGLQQVFSCTGTGTVVMPASVQKFPEWWGAVGDNSTDDAVPLQAWATCGGNLNLPKKTYKTTAIIIVPQYAVIDGWGTIHQTTDTVGGLAIYDDVTVKNITLQATGTATLTETLHQGILSYSVHMGTSSGTSALATYVGKRVIIDNVKFNGGWYTGTTLTSNCVVKNSQFDDCVAEGILFHGVENRALFNVIDTCGSWAIDFNGGDAEASYNIIRACGQTAALAGDGGGIVFAGLASIKPMTDLRAIGNTIDDHKYGSGIFVRSQDTNGVWGDITISNNYVNGNDTTNAVIGIWLSTGTASTVTCKNFKITDNIVKNSRQGIRGSYLEGGTVQGNILQTIHPDNVTYFGAMQFGAINKTVIGPNVIKDVNGTADNCLWLEGTINNSRITHNIGEGGAVGLWNATGMTGTGNAYSDNDFSGCTTAVFLQAALTAGNRLERNVGYNPVVPTTPAVPATTIEYRNIFGYPIMVCITGGGAAVTAISKGPTSGALVATGFTVNATSTHATVILAPDEYISWTGAGAAPTWVFLPVN